MIVTLTGSVLIKFSGHLADAMNSIIVSTIVYESTKCITDTVNVISDLLLVLHACDLCKVL